MRQSFAGGFGGALVVAVALGGCSAKKPSSFERGTEGAEGAPAPAQVPEPGGTGRDEGVNMPSPGNGQRPGSGQQQGSGDSDTAPSTALFDGYSFSRGASYEVSAPGVLSNDSMGAELMPSSISTTRGGTVQLAGDGGFSYSPAFPAFWGDDTFEYSVSYGQASSSAQVRVSVQPQQPLRLADVDVGGNGFSLRLREDESGGAVVADAGDFNGDGFEDILVGVPNASPNGETNAGQVFLVFGSTASRAASFGLQSIRPEQGIVLAGLESNAQLGFSVAGAGDVNGDGLADIVLGAPGARDQSVAQQDTAARLGAAYVIFGTPNPTSAAVVDLARGSTGYTVTGDTFGLRAGSVVAGVGDVSGDGRDDVLIGAVTEELQSNDYAAYVVFGASDASSINLDDLERAGGFRFVLEEGEEASRPHLDAARAGDLNGDGLQDIALSAGGVLTVLYGRVNPSSINSPQPLAATRGFEVVAGNGHALLDSAVGAAGDYNGDGYDDLLLTVGIAPLPIDDEGGPPSEELRGLYVLFGGSDIATVNLSTLQPEQGVTFPLVGILGDCSRASLRVSGDRDFDGDGLSDLLTVYWPEGTCNSEILRQALLVRGSSQPPEQSLDSLTVPAGIALQGANDRTVAPAEVAALGDVDGDGLDDFALLAEGVVYVGYGWNWGGASDLGGRHLALAGVFQGDEMVWSGAEPLVRARGSAGASSRLVLSGEGVTLDARARGRLSSVEHVDLGDSGTNRLVLSDHALRTIAQSRPDLPGGLTRTLIVSGAAGSVVEVEGFEQFASRGSNGGRRVLAKPGAFYGVELGVGVECVGCP